MEKHQPFCLDEKEDEEEWIDENAFCSALGTKFSDLSKQHTVKLADYNPQKKHMSVGPGLNLKGSCYNPNCNASKSESRVTWIPRGFATFKLSELVFENLCQGCGQEVEAQSILTFGFTRASVTISGRRKIGEKKYQKVDPIKLVEKEGKFVKFQDSDEKIVEWVDMTIDVKKI